MVLAVGDFTKSEQFWNHADVISISSCGLRDYHNMAVRKSFHKQQWNNFAPSV